MSIDLFTFVAQIINFIILVLLLRHFLYKRIIRVMDEREKNIARRIEEAETKKKGAEEEAAAYQKKKNELEEKGRDLISRAQREAEDRKKELLQKARDEVDRTQKHWRESLQRQKEMFLHDLRRRAGEQVFETAKRALKDLADENLEKQIVETFLQRLLKLGDEEKQMIRDSLERSDQEAVILSRFKIPENLRDKAEKAIKDFSGRDVRVQFKTSEDLIGGVELDVRDRKVAWGIDVYLESLEENMAVAFEQKVSEEEKDQEEENIAAEEDEGARKKEEGKEPRKKKT
ncbi:MAG: ATP F0F1 synthase subunit B [Candidatus Aminicenantes bacterium]|nr:ATP F0F1 synthase subunit B [Candidatus Aminicenantes bacterium]